MSESIGTLNLKISASSEDLQRGFRSASDEVGKFAKTSQQAGADVRTSFAESQSGVSRIFDTFQSKNGASIAGELKSGLGGMASEALGAAGAFGTMAAVGVGALSSLYSHAREATKELNALFKQSQRIGETAFNTQVVNRAFERAGMSGEEAQLTQNRFFDKLGDIRNNPGGESANAFRQIGLDPQQLANAGPRQAIEETIAALGSITNVYDRSSAAQAIFSRQWQDLAPLIDRGRGAFTDAANSVRNSGFDEETLKMANAAEKNWKTVGRLGSDLGDKLSAGFKTFFTWVGHGLSVIVEGVASSIRWWAELFGILDKPRPEKKGSDFRTGEVAQAEASADRLDRIVNRPRKEPIPAAKLGVEMQKQVQSMEEQIHLGETLRSSAISLGLARVDATKQEIDSVKDLITARNKFIQQGATEAQLRNFDETARVRVASQTRQEFRDMAREWQNGAETIGMTTREISILRARQRGVSEAVLEELHSRDRILTNMERRNQLEQQFKSQLESSQSSVGKFQDSINKIAEIGIGGRVVTSVLAQNQLLANSFRELERSLGNGPSSFALTGLDPRSMEGAKHLLDLQVRQENGLNDPQQRIVAALEAAREIQAEQLRETQIIADALRNTPGLGLAPVRE